MSIVLDRPITPTRFPQVNVPALPTPGIPVQPEFRPGIDTPVAAPAKVGRRSARWVTQYIALKAALFVAIFVATYVASTLSGHYLLEKSRNRSNDASARATIALQDEQEVQRQVDFLTSKAAITDWATRNSFRPTDGLGDTSKVNTIVARNP